MIAGIIVGLVIGEIVGGMIGWNIGFGAAYKDLDEMLSMMDGNDLLRVDVIQRILQIQRRL